MKNKKNKKNKKNILEHMEDAWRFSCCSLAAQVIGRTSSWPSPKRVPRLHWFDSHLTSQISRQGKNRASGCESFEEKCCFRHNETIDPFHKKCLKTKNHRGIGSAFLMISFTLQGNWCWKLARCFPPFTWPCGSSKSYQWPPKKVSCFGVHPTPLPDPDASH